MIISIFVGGFIAGAIFLWTLDAILDIMSSDDMDESDQPDNETE